MKNFFPFLLVLVFITGCAEEEPALEEQRIEGSWKIVSMVQDSAPQVDWNDLEMTFTEMLPGQGLYSLTGSPNESIWKAAGSYALDDANKEVFYRDSNLIINILKNRNDSLVFEQVFANTVVCDPLSYDPCTPTLQGSFEFHLVKSP